MKAGTLYKVKSKTMWAAQDIQSWRGTNLREGNHLIYLGAVSSVCGIYLSAVGITYVYNATIKAQERA